MKGVYLFRKLVVVVVVWQRYYCSQIEEKKDGAGELLRFKELRRPSLLTHHVRRRPASPTDFQSHGPLSRNAPTFARAKVLTDSGSAAVVGIGRLIYGICSNFHEKFRSNRKPKLI
jgi:hypothetical protein